MFLRISFAAVAGLLFLALAPPAMAQPSQIDQICLARQFRLTGEFSECLSKSTARVVRRNPEALFTADAPALRGDTSCRNQFLSRMRHFAGIFENRGASGEFCGCAMSPESAVVNDIVQMATWGRTCEQIFGYYITEARPEVVAALQNVAGGPLPAPEELEDFCDEGDVGGSLFGPIFGGAGSPFGDTNLIFPPLNMLSLFNCAP